MKNEAGTARFYGRPRIARIAFRSGENLSCRVVGWRQRAARKELADHRGLSFVECCCEGVVLRLLRRLLRRLISRAPLAAAPETMA